MYIRAFFCALLLACCAASQPAPELATHAPIAIKAGQSADITLSGSHLKSVQSITPADSSGLTATLVEPAKDDQIHLKLTTKSDAAVGDRQLRLLGPNGVTRPVRVLVTAYDVHPLSDSQDSKPLALPATLTGSISTPGQSHQFQFPARKGELLVFDVSSRRIGSPLEPVVTLQNDSGRQLRATVEPHGSDPVVLFNPPEDATYTLRIRDLRFRGGPEYHFRINAGHIPYLESLTPGSGKPGSVVKAKPVGHNLDNADPITIDLTHSAPGRINVLATTPLGPSNEIPFEVTDLPQLAESEPNDSPDESNLVQLPVEISAAADRPADEDFFRFRLPYKQPVAIEVLAARLGSPMIPLLQLRDVKGNVIESNDGAPDYDARIIRQLDAGEYIASVRDLAYSGGPGHWYRLKIEPARTIQGDFSFRLQPENPRLHRGGHVAVWFDVKRTNNLRGDITLLPQSLPPGVAVSPLTLPENGSGWLTISATPDVPLGTAPLRIGAQASTGMTTVTHDSQSDAYLTMLDPAPFTIQTLANLTTQQTEEAKARLQSLTGKLAAPPDAKLEAAQAQWEKKVPKEPVWKPLEASSVTSAKGAKMLRLSDSSVLAAGPTADQDDYTVVAHTDLKSITAVRLEAINDDRLPASGPGLVPNGNFVLSAFKLTAVRGTESPQQITFSSATADFAQDNFPAANAINPKPNTGWAILPQTGRRHTAIFRTANPISAGPDTTLTFTLSHQSSFAKHNLGRFRLSVTTLAPALLDEFGNVPTSVLAAAALPADERSPQQKSEIATYYRSIDPERAAIRTQADALRSFIGPQVELQRVQATLSASTPQLDAEQKLWEQTVSRGGSPVPERILAILKTPDASRNPAQNKQLSDYYRTLSPTLAVLRDRLAELRAQASQVPPQGRRNQPMTIPVLLTRAEGFKGPVTVTLEGYAPGSPRMTARQIRVTPLSLNNDALFGLLTIQPEPGAELATRMVVLKAESKTQDDTLTQYSPAFPLTISN